MYTGGGEYDWDFTQNKANEITGWDNQSPGGNVTPVYDAAGNMTDAKRDWRYEYDAWYRLVRVRAQNGSGGDIVAEFKYNGLGHRISARYPSGGETAPWFHFAYDERWRMVAMYEDDAATDVPTEQFWHHNAGPSGFGGSSYIDDVVLRDRATGAEGEGILDERVYYLQNWHHDVVALVDTSGAIVERANYDGYGMPIGTLSTNGNRRGYAGYEIDPVLAGHWHVRHRVLRSDLGVWTRRDPIGPPKHVHLYAYPRIPTLATDPSGALAVWPCNPFSLVTHEHLDCCTDAINRQRPRRPDEPETVGETICCNGELLMCQYSTPGHDEPACSGFLWYMQMSVFEHECCHCKEKYACPDTPGYSDPIWLQPRSPAECKCYCHQIHYLQEARRTVCDALGNDDRARCMECFSNVIVRIGVAAMWFCKDAGFDWDKDLPCIFVHPPDQYRPCLP